jgi:hypothetical protein
MVTYPDADTNTNGHTIANIMAQTASATLKANAQSVNRVVSVQLQIAWGRKGDSWPTDWATQSTDETTRLRDVSWERSLDLDAGTLGRGFGVVAQMRLLLDNSAQRFSPLNTAGALYSSLSAATTTPGGESVRYPAMWSTPVRLQMGFYDAGAGHERIVVFSGVIDAVQETYGIGGDTVVLTCLDRGALLLKKKASTPIRAGFHADEWIRLLVSGYGGITTGATFDRGLHIIPYSWLDDEDLWSECQLAAGSEGGSFFFSETGAATFKNVTWWQTAADSLSAQATFTTARLQNIMPGYDYKRLNTGALVQYQARAPGGQQVIWRKEGLAIPPSGLTIDARFSHPTENVIQPKKPDDWFPVSPGGIDMSASISLAFFTPMAQRATLVFANSSYQTVFIPKMELRGLVLSGGPQEEVERNVTSPLVPENQAIVSGNPYIQTKGQAELIATLAAYRNSYPRLMYEIAGAPALPWLQLGDCVAITVSEPITASRNSIITELSFSWKPDSPFLMTLTAVDKAALYEYSDYHVIGTDTYGSKRVFV